MTNLRSLATILALFIIGLAQAQTYSDSNESEVKESDSSESSPLPYLNPQLDADERAADLCQRLTLEEKAALMRNGSPAIERLGIPMFEWWSEALHGAARNGYATVFPIPMAMASSFDNALLEKVFTAVGDEMRAKNNIARKTGTVGRYQGLSIWTPNINIFRDPRWGRGQETYGEDPYLTSVMGLAVVKGLQGPTDSKYRKNLACAKHFAVHSGPEWNRHSFNVEELPERDLWETYLPAFKTLVTEGNVAEIMCAYQRFDGKPCCGSDRLLIDILRNEWKFQGIVCSDCGAISDFFRQGRHGVAQDAAEASAMAVLTGTDIECGGEYAALPKAVANGQISEEDIDVSVKRLLKMRMELGDFDPDSLVEWTALSESIIASEDHRKLALDMARESIVLLKNDGILPLNPSQASKIVVVGPNATDSTSMWGNYYGYPLSTTTILEGIRKMAGNVRYVAGCGHTRNEVFDSRYDEIYAPDGSKGMKATYWNNMRYQGEPAAECLMAQPINLSNGGSTAFAPGVELSHFSAKYEGIFRPTRTEQIRFSLNSDDTARLIINGDTIIRNRKNRRINIADMVYEVEAGKEYAIQIDYVQDEDVAALQFDLGHLGEMDAKRLLDEVGDAEIVIFVGGISPRLEGEEMSVKEPGFKGGDREDIELPEAQRNALATLYEAGKRIVLVNCSGSAMGLEPENGRSEAILQAWYGGEAGGQAVGEILFGAVNPSGKLPVTFYKSVAQLPDYQDYTMKGRTYRYFDGEPLYSFGFGLSYTSFEVGEPQWDGKAVSVEISNTGSMEGSEILQVYIRRKGDNDGPIKALRGFKRVSLEAGETAMVRIDIPENHLETWDSSTNTMRLVPGKYEFLVGTSSRDSDLKVLEISLF